MNQLTWWQTAVFYQIYPRSFADGNGDGIGDFQGMIGRLDYLKDLGVDAIWLSPHYPSPLFDCGYDIADYTGVAPEYGTLEDFKGFLEGLHQRGMRLILDFVLNHTSDQHPWFLESRSSLDNPKRDWYVWRDGRADNPFLPPNNWYSIFGGSAWEHDPASGQQYYHYFFKEQPDLNWRNPEVKQAMFEAARFWLDLGVDGFRLDALGTIFEDPEMLDQTAELSQQELFAAYQATYPNEPDEQTAAYLNEQFRRMNEYQVDQPGVHELMQELRALVDEYEDRVLVGETDEITYYGDGDNELHLTFNFPLMRIARLTPAWIRANQQERLAALPLGAWPCNTLGNHDSPRVYSRYGDGEHSDALARLHLALMLTLRGTPFLYNGEEIGMSDRPLADITQFRDNLGVWLYQLVTEFGVTSVEALAMANQMSRDKCRTPLQWSHAANGGFSPANVQTWLPVNPNYAQGVNVTDQLADPDSLLHFYRRLLHLRQQNPALISGDYEVLPETADDYLAFLRQTEAQRCLVVLNFSDQSQVLSLGLESATVHLIFSNQERKSQQDSLSQLAIASFEIYLGELK